MVEKKSEAKLATLDEQIASLDSDFFSTIEEEGERKVSVRKINQRQSEIELQYNRQRRDLDVRRNGVVNRLNQKLSVVNSMVQFLGADIDNARADYQFQFNAAISLVNLIQGIEAQEKTDQQRDIDNARANLQIMYNTIRDGNVGYEDLDPATLLDIRTMEVEAGLPGGFVKYISSAIDEPVITFLPAFTDVNGNRIQPVATTSADGTFKINNVNIGKAKTTDDTKAKLISQATLNKLAAAGVPEVVALDIQRSLNSGILDPTIRAHLIKQVGEQKGNSYMDEFLSVMGAGGGEVFIN